jgi:hypothetical protein
MDYIRKLLADHAGDPSSMRVMSFLSLITGIVLASVGLAVGKDLSSLAVLSGVFVGAAFGGKAAQSSIENKNNQ